MTDPQQPEWPTQADADADADAIGYAGETRSSVVMPLVTSVVAAGVVAVVLYRRQGQERPPGAIGTMVDVMTVVVLVLAAVTVVFGVVMTIRAAVRTSRAQQRLAGMSPDRRDAAQISSRYARLRRLEDVAAHIGNEDLVDVIKAERQEHAEQSDGAATPSRERRATQRRTER